MIRAILSPYSPRYPAVLVYMLQNTEYQEDPYLKWYWRTQDFSSVEHRRQLVHTRAADLIWLVLSFGMLLQIAVGLLLIFQSWRYDMPGIWAFGAALVISYPVVWAHLILVPLAIGRIFLAGPAQRRRVAASAKIFLNHSGEKIAIVGSYGKTSMKELLLTIIGDSKKVAATPANKNVPISHAVFAQSLIGNEDIVLIEYGEGAPGDVARFARVTHPTRAIITGVAAAHLDHYKSTEAAGEDIFSVASFIREHDHVYVNGESTAATAFIKPGYETYDHNGALGWRVGSVKSDINGLSFTLSKRGEKLFLKSGLLGRHNLGPLSLAAALALELGIDKKAVIAGVGRTKPFEHRMQPYQLNGAWVIDDTYNGNIEGIRAGTELLRELPAHHKLYATPGLVDQGGETETVHEQMGRLIAESGADTVILMQNSVTKFITAGLNVADFHGELMIEPDPLAFYTNLGQFIAAGDLVMLQNDWPDNYA